MHYVLQNGFPLFEDGSFRRVEQNDGFFDDISNGAVVQQSHEHLEVGSHHSRRLNTPCRTLTLLPL
jgi:hypothetical protein